MEGDSGCSRNLVKNEFPMESELGTVKLLVGTFISELIEFIGLCVSVCREVESARHGRHARSHRSAHVWVILMMKILRRHEMKCSAKEILFPSSFHMYNCLLLVQTILQPCSVGEFYSLAIDKRNSAIIISNVLFQNGCGDSVSSCSI